MQNLQPFIFCKKMYTYDFCFRYIEGRSKHRPTFRSIKQKMRLQKIITFFNSLKKVQFVVPIAYVRVRLQKGQRRL